jgi:uncharacterized protein
MVDYALLFFGAFSAAAISGAAGFGGALLLLPPLTHTVGVTEDIPLLTIAQLVGNLSRAALGFREIRWQPVLLFLVGATPAAVIGALSFVTLPTSLIIRLVGMAILTFVAIRMLGLMTFAPGRGLLVGGGAVVGLLSGLVGSAGPLGAAIFLTLNLPPIAYIASEAVTATGMHAVKSVVYGSRINLGTSFWPLALAMVLGTWASKRVIERIPVKRFRQFVGVLLIVIAVQMIITG